MRRYNLSIIGVCERRWNTFGEITTTRMTPSFALEAQMKKTHNVCKNHHSQIYI
jgi:hypothetical protein